MDIAIPRCFQPLHGTRSGEIRFYDLEKYRFKREEKLFLCRELQREHELLLPTYFCQNNTTKKSARGLEERHNVPHGKFSKWLSSYKKGEPLHDSPGRPTALDKESIENIENRIVNGNVTTQSLLVQDFAKVVKEEVKNTQKRRGKRLFPETDPDISLSYVHKCKKLMGVKARKPQDLTPARLAALRDIRMVYRIACSYEAFSGHLPATHKWNADATTFIISPNGAGSLVCTIPTKETLVKLDSSVVPNGLNILVKWVLMASAQGETSPCVLIITVPDMPEGKFYVRKVVGLTGKDVVGDFGWLYFCKTRAGNAALWQHWFLNVVIPTLQATRRAHDIKYCGQQRPRIFMSIDGEAIILQEAFAPEVIAGLKEEDSDMMKGGPGTTSKFQACDRMVCFRDLKCRLKYHARVDTDMRDDTLRCYMELMFEDFFATFGIELVSTQKEKIVSACEKVVYVMREKYLTPNKIAKGFIACGQHVVGAAVGMSTVSYDRIMSGGLCEDITEEEYDHMRNMRPLVIARFKRDGRVLNPYLDELGIVADPDATDRDNLTLCRQDCQLITHEDTIQRYREKNPPVPMLYSSPPPTNRTSAVSQVSEKDVVEAQKVVQGVLARQLKAAAKAEKKEQEIQRLAGLTVAQRQAEAAAKRDAKATAKAAKEAARLASEDAARQLLGMTA